MDESTCFLRSFHNATGRCTVAEKGELIHVLGQSTTFGRFISESLASENWSAFSRNRYVEEAEKLSKPGSVAEKKAYFEVYFTKKAAGKAAALIQEANVSANRTFDSETQDGNCNYSSTGIMSDVESNENVTEQLDENAVNYQVDDYADRSKYKCDIATKQLHEYAVNYQFVDYADLSKYKCDNEQSEADISELANTENVTQPYVDANLNVENSIKVDNCNQPGNVEVHEKIAIPREKWMPDRGTEQLDENAVNSQVVDYAGESKHKSDNEQSEAGICRVARAENVTQRHVDANLNVENSIQVDNSNRLDNIEVHEKNAIPREKWMPDPRTAGQEILALPIKGREVHTSPKLSIKTRAAKILRSLPQRKATDGALESKKSVAGSIGKKRLTAQSLHKPINVPFRPGETGQTPSVSELNRSKKIDPNLPKISKDRPVASQTSTRVSHDSFHQASANPKSEDRSDRTQRILDKSVSEGVTANAKVSSFSVECLMNPPRIARSDRPLTIFSPFRFRSEERAAKRKEFFQRMEEIKSKEVEKGQLKRRLKEKIEHVHKKLHQNSGSKPKLNQDMFGGLTPPINQTREEKTEHVHKKLHQNSGSSPKLNEDMFGGGLPRPINQTRKRPPLGRKQNSSALKESRNSGKPPINTNNSKRDTENIKGTRRQSFISLAKKTPRENASPNIQH